MKQIIKFSIIAIIAIGVFACHRQKADSIGPGYIDAPKGFTVTSFNASATSINLTPSTSAVLFNATFPATVSWVLTITGQRSGAVSTLKGTSNGFTGEKWKGVQDNIYFFRKGENVTATLSFYGTTYTTSLVISLTGVPNFSVLGVAPVSGPPGSIGAFEDITIGHVLTGFTGNPPYSSTSTIYSNYGWSAFNFPNPIPNEEQGIDSAAIDYNGNKVPSVEGSYYYFIKGLGNQPSFVSGLQYQPYVPPSPPAHNAFYDTINKYLPSDPSQVWVNMYIYGTGDANAEVQLEYQEDDSGSRTVGYVSGEDDSWDATLTLNHTGWKLFSIRYSDLVITANKFFGGNGNHIMEPNRISSFDLVLVKKTYPNKPVEVYFDYPIITVGGPFKPSK